MVSLASACRASARLAARRGPHVDACKGTHGHQAVFARKHPMSRHPLAFCAGFRTSASALVAQNFTMPALSPTMVEGTIASWHVKEGDRFSAGDVLLEIETDKATMDVEAQEDGIMMKIFQGDGSKGVQVGSRIAVLAEAGDDVSALEIPADASPKVEKAASPKPPPSPKAQADSPQSAPKTRPKAGGKARKQTYPLMPSVAHLIKENSLDDSAVGHITATGPNGRLLKGDVLAHLGKINAATPAAVSSRFDRASHLDLSKIKVARAPEGEPVPEEAPSATPPPPQLSSVSTSISLSAVAEVQKKVHDTIGVSLPLSTFIDRATEVANDELPLPSACHPTADELFGQVLGSDKVKCKVSRGAYLPRIAALPLSCPTAPRPERKPDLIDLLAASRPASERKKAVGLQPGLSSGTNVFSLQVPKPETKRAQVFLERIKLVLEKEPGRLVL